MHYKPCTDCARKFNCEKYEALSKTLKGTGATSITFKCDIMRADFKLGDKVKGVAVRRWWTGDYKGTFVEWENNKARVKLDASNSVIKREGGTEYEQEVTHMYFHHAELRKTEEFKPEHIPF